MPLHQGGQRLCKVDQKEKLDERTSQVRHASYVGKPPPQKSLSITLQALLQQILDFTKAIQFAVQVGYLNNVHSEQETASLPPPATIQADKYKDLDVKQYRFDDQTQEEEQEQANIFCVHLVWELVKLQLLA